MDLKKLGCDHVISLKLPLLTISGTFQLYDIPQNFAKFATICTKNWGNQHAF